MPHHNTLDALIFDQTSAEDYAMYVQTFHLARLRLQEEVRLREERGEDPATFYITSDLDETLLDNSAYRAWLMATGRDYHPQTFTSWCNDVEARATPGALEFIHFAANTLGVKVIYVSSRDENVRASTAANLVKLGFPLPDAGADASITHLFLLNMKLDPAGPKTTKKEQYAFLRLRMGAAPMLQLGDNLSDHEPQRYSRRVRFDERARQAEGDMARWGRDWIVFPNPAYGGWRDTLKAVINGKDTLLKDESTAVADTPDPVRPPLSVADTPKLAVLSLWQPKSSIP